MAERAREGEAHARDRTLGQEDGAADGRVMEGARAEAGAEKTDSAPIPERQAAATSETFKAPPSETAAAESVKALTHAAGFLRSRLAQTLKLRTIPELHFVYDASVERGVRLSKLIDEAVQSGSGPEPEPS